MKIFLSPLEVGLALLYPHSSYIEHFRTSYSAQIILRQFALGHDLLEDRDYILFFVSFPCI